VHSGRNLHGLGAVYEDFLSAEEGADGRAYTVTCGNDRNAIKPGSTDQNKITSRRQTHSAADVKLAIALGHGRPP
jgi:hypothetical protein